MAVLCPVCSREYATRTSLEIHLYGRHPGLSARERSALLQGAINGRDAWEEPARASPETSTDAESAEV